MAVGRMVAKRAPVITQIIQTYGQRTNYGAVLWEWGFATALYNSKDPQP